MFHRRRRRRRRAAGLFFNDTLFHQIFASFVAPFSRPRRRCVAFYDILR